MSGISGPENGSDAAPVGDDRRDWQALGLHLVAPALILVAALLLPSFMLQNDRPFRGSGLGPAAWPNVMLTLTAVLAGIWLAQELLGWRRSRSRTAAEAPTAGEREEYSYGKAAAGLGMIVAYGWLLPVIGFPIATVVFIATWCILGGIRSPLALLGLSMIGTVALLWLFMGLALMPLSRGQGLFDRISVALLQTLGIY